MDSLVALVVRGDHELNAIKAEKLAGSLHRCRWRRPNASRPQSAARPASSAPLGLTIPVYADHSAVHMADFVCGANQVDEHLTGVNWGRDLPNRRPSTSATSSPATRARAAAHCRLPGELKSVTFFNWVTSTVAA